MELRVDAENLLREPEPRAVLKRIRDWEIQILKNGDSKHLGELCSLYLNQPLGALRDLIGNEIMKGERSKSKIEELIRAVSEARDELSMPIFSIIEASISTNKSIPTQNLPQPPFLPELPEQQLPEQQHPEQSEYPEMQPEMQPEPLPQTIKELIVQEMEKQAEEKGLPEVRSVIERTRDSKWEEIIQELMALMKEAKNSSQTAPAPRKTSKKALVCFNCDKKGHIVKYCPNRARKPSSPKS
ncbi:hypothetical protein NEDG_00119 [Nematocida displodere]|uniref:CCHC-type domain-containing protein n=1 Tax=Nematocida displodere TaxID=1805483 RepID=A0A177EI39_9MICR|nr:hypothetical protein NEDG_00119 [Nematocida displodere]